MMNEDTIEYIGEYSCFEPQDLCYLQLLFNVWPSRSSLVLHLSICGSNDIR